jgi:hypothetical protein
LPAEFHSTIPVARRPPVPRPASTRPLHWQHIVSFWCDGCTDGCGLLHVLASSRVFGRANTAGFHPNLCCRTVHVLGAGQVRGDVPPCPAVQPHPGDFTWQEYEWMLENARRLVSRDRACQSCWCLFHRLRSLGSTKSGNMHTSSRPASPGLLAVRVDVWSLLRHRRLFFADCTTQGRTRVAAVRD